MADIIVTEKDAARFQTKTRRNEATGCLEWIGHRDKCGYGRLQLGRTTFLAHRISWVLNGGHLPDGAMVLHRCDTPACVEISHLFLGDHRTNMADMVAKGRSLSGDKNRSRWYPERLPHGETHRMRLHPEERFLGEKNGSAKLTDGIVRMIRAACASGEDQRTVAERHGVTQSNVSRIVSHKTWTHVA